MSKPETTTTLCRDIAATIDRCFEIGAGNAMREEEAAKGYVPLKFGDRPWLKEEDWIEDIVMSLDGSRVRIVALIAKETGCGTFSRMITSIIKDGLKPVVVAPLPQMEEILRSWDWRQVIRGSCFHDRVDEWHPQRKFIEARRSH